ncbi:unnamed protein product [Bemisia tabaci]|uniref:Ionotropic receptor n=1 Tax=Bemisia tabaci TaxID=7038 RepID=A0A9P0AFH9_BEMTA|nr:unnamed protein product [Bemisia tabaci]
MDDKFKFYGTEAGLKFDIDLQPFDYGLSLEGTNYSRVFYFFYPDAEVEFYRNSSSLFTVYAYFMCGSPANLRLGHLMTGKALFVIFSFSAFIITNAFLGCMTTLLSKRVLYPEIDSLHALEESELLIQIIHGDVPSQKEMFSQQNQSEVLSAKLVTNLYDYSIGKFGEFILNSFSFPVDDECSEVSNFSNYHITEIKKNILSMAAVDAMMVSLPFSSRRKENIRINHGFCVDFEYHLMQECLITYPVMIPVLKNSFLYDKLNRIIYQNLETGHTERILEGSDTGFIEFSSEGNKCRER